MPGVMVVDELGCLDSSTSSSMFQSSKPYPSPSMASAALKLSIQDMDSDEFLSGGIPSDLNSTVMPKFSNLNFCNAVAPSSPERGSSRMFNDDARENIGCMLYPRSFSKLSGNRVAEDLILQSEAYDQEGSPSENGGDNDPFFAFTASDFKDCVIEGASFPLSGVTFNNSASIVGTTVAPDPMMGLQKFLPSNNEDGDLWPAMDFYSCDEFRMYEFKVRKCMRGRSHDWTECPFAHPGEKARRRDPRRFHYSGTACPDFRKGSCRRGDACEFAHGVFECWLHPARYRTQPCKDGRNCKRRVCFFAHTPEQLRLLPVGTQASATSTSRSTFCSSSKSSLSGSYDGSPLRQALSGSSDSHLSLENWPGLVHGDLTSEGHPGSPAITSTILCRSTLGCPSFQILSPTSTLAGHSQSPPALSPPLSPSGSPPLSPDCTKFSRTCFARCLSGSSKTPQVSLPQIQGSGAHFLSNSPAMLAPAMSTHGPSPLSCTSPAQRRHLDRLQSLSSLSALDFEGRDGFSMSSPGADQFNITHSQAVDELVTTLQHFQLRAHVAEANNTAPTIWSSKPSALSSASYSLPVSPMKPKWMGQTDPWETFCDVETAPQRVESGRGLRAIIYAKLCKENPLETDSPDLGWVNELVK